VEISPAASQFTGRVHQHSIRSPHDADQLPLCQHSATTDASPLGNMFNAFDRFGSHILPPPVTTLKILKSGRGEGNLLLFFPDAVGAFVLLARHDFAQFLVELKFNGFLLALLLALLLIVALGFFLGSGRSKGLGLE
jgi:hypothetical protein